MSSARSILEIKYAFEDGVTLNTNNDVTISINNYYQYISRKGNNYG